MKGCVQWNPVYDWREFCLLWVSNLGLLYQQASAYLIEPLELLPVKVLIKVIYAIYLHCYLSIVHFYPILNNPNILDQFYKTNLESWDCFRKGKTSCKRKSTTDLHVLGQFGRGKLSCCQIHMVVEWMHLQSRAL